MPPLALLAPLAGSVLGSALLPSIAGSTLLGVGTSTLGGALGGALAGGLTNQDDPLMGALLGGAGGALGGPGLLDLGTSAASGVGDLLGMGGSLGDTALSGVASGLESGTSALATGLGAGTSAAASGAEGLGGAGVSADALSGASGLGGQGVATGLDSVAGATGSGVDAAGTALSSGSFGPGSFGEALAPAATSTLPQAPGAAQAVTTGTGAAGGGISPVNITPQIDLAGTALEGATGPTTALGTAISDPSFANILNAVGANKDLIGAGAAAIPLLTGSSSMPGQEQLNSLAKQMSGSSAALTGYLNSGTLPPGVQAGLKSANESAKAAMRSMFASRGMSGSSSEVAALANIDQTTAAQGAEIAMKLLDRGIQQQQMSSALYQVILRNAMEEDKAFGEAIGRFGAAMAA